MMAERGQSRPQRASGHCTKSGRLDNQDACRRHTHSEDGEAFKNDLNEASKVTKRQPQGELCRSWPSATSWPCKEAASFLTLKQQRRPATSSMAALSLISFCHCYLILVMVISISSLARAQQVAGFPGVSRDLASFCSARPSLSIDLASMVVHVKRSTSFNYKLYLFSSDNYVFQTGQIVPRDDFRVHSFPVKLKSFSDFLPVSVPTFQQTGSGKLAPVVSSKFNAKAFFSQVPISPASSARKRKHTGKLKRQQRQLQANSKQQVARAPAFDVLDHGDVLPGDETSSAPFGHHDVALAQEHTARHSQAANSNVQFDRDDQLAVLGAASALHEVSRRESGQPNPTHSASIADRLASRNEAARERPASHFDSHQQMVMPVGAFSSFQVNTTYLVRKDFDQRQPELVRLQIDPYKFQVSEVHLLGMPQADNASSLAAASATQLDDLAFLKHKLLSDQNTRITSINQIYEDWISRNFYTIVYIQRRLEAPDMPSSRPVGEDEMDVSLDRASGERNDSSMPQTLIVTDRLIFRGSSVVLLGADQLDYEVKASAFITEKNGLHYYFEFLTQGKFYLGAIDWSRRPFTIIDAQRFPFPKIKTKFDNEELLLCPPSVCYSERPIDELVSYGRLGLPEKLGREAAVLTRALSGGQSSGKADPASRPQKLFTLPASTHLAPPNRTVDEQDHKLTYAAALAIETEEKETGAEREQKHSDGYSMQSHDASRAEMISLDELIEWVRAASSQLDLRLHLRDWTWSLPRVAPKVGANKLTFSSSSSSRLNASNMTLASGSSRPANATAPGRTREQPVAMSARAFAWHFEWARRNEIKVTPDTYGFVLTGHEIDASYRVYDELHLISANHLITINYTLANETVTSAQPIGDEFQGLSSSLLDPITGAYYDRYANQLYFFKGDRYVGYDYATKRPLEDFLLPPPVDSLVVAPGGSPLLQAALGEASGASPAVNRRQLTQPLVSSLPVVGILGRQHYVDAIWHDLHDDAVYVFSGAKFYAFHASDFKDGAFRASRQPAFRCINEHFLEGCRFDEAFPNPCHEPEASIDADDDETNEVEVDPKQRLPEASGNSSTATVTSMKMKLSKLTADLQRELEFNEEQQMKLRSIAARGGLLDVLLDNTFTASNREGPGSGLGSFQMWPISRPGSGVIASDSTPQERSLIYLLISMVLITILVTIAMIFVILNWGRSRAHLTLNNADPGPEKPNNVKDPHVDEQQDGMRILADRIAYPPAISQYLSNQYHHHQLQQSLPYQNHYDRRHQVPLNYLGRPPTHYEAGPRRQSQGPLPQPPQTINKPPVSSPNRSPGKRFDNLVDSSAL